MKTFLTTVKCKSYKGCNPAIAPLALICSLSKILEIEANTFAETFAGWSTQGFLKIAGHAGCVSNN
jgi:hypothetical protein